MELWRFWNRIEALCRRYKCQIVSRCNGTDCLHFSFNRGGIEGSREVRWNFMKTSEYQFFDILEEELKLFEVEVNSFKERVGM